MEESNKQFDTAEYAYLDKLTLLAGWMWEFIRRSPDYSQRYDRIKELSQKAVLKATSKEFYFHNYKFTKSSDGNVLHNEIRDLEKECFVRPLIMLKKKNVSETFLLIRAGQITYKSKRVCNIYVGIPNPNVRYCDFETYRPFIRGATPVSYHRFVPEAIDFCEKDRYHKAFSRIFRDKLTLDNLQNTLYLGISLKANLEEIIDEIKIIFRQNKKLKERRRRPKEWKYYLIVYDLKENIHLTYKNISEEVSKPCKSEIERLDEILEKEVDEKKKKRLEKKKTELDNLYKNLSDEKNIRNYYDKAKTLINYEIKKLLKTY